MFEILDIFTDIKKSIFAPLKYKNIVKHKPNLMKKTLFLLGLTLLILLGGCKKNDDKFTCTITSPKNGAELSIYEDIVVTIEAKNYKGTIAMIVVWLENAPYPVTQTAPYTCTIPASLLTLGEHTIKAVATTIEGAQAESSIKVKIVESGGGGNADESPNFVSFADGRIPASWKTNTWVVDVAMGYDADNQSLRADNPVSSVLTTKTMSAASYVEFYIRSGSYGDFFELYIDNVKATALSSSSDGNWKKWIYAFDKGKHSFRWENTNGATIHLDAVKFALAAVPTVTTTVDVTKITATSATSGGNVTGNGNSPITARGVCWSTSENPTIDDSKTTDGTTTGSFTSNMTELTPNTVYYVRAYATNGAGTGYGEQVSFTTEPLNVPAVTTSNVTNITISSAESGGNVTHDGYSAVTARGVCWSTSQNPTINDTKTVSGSGTGSFTSNITGLTPNTLYYVRAYATNGSGTGYGEERTFKSLSINMPAVTTGSITDITVSSAKCEGTVTNDGNDPSTTRGVCWSTSQNPTISDNKTVDGKGTGNFTSSITGLERDKLYYVRAYATNSAGTAYGAQKSFTTLKFKIGDTYQGGVIFYIDNTQQHGMIAAPSDNSTVLCWDCYANVHKFNTNASGYDIGTGKSNTDLIVKVIGEGDYAAKLCYDLNIDGISDWYLPSWAELKQLYITRNVVGLKSMTYWSSTEEYSYDLKNFRASALMGDYYGEHLSAYRTSEYRVRCVRDF